MKIPKIIRPEIELEYYGILGFLYAVYAVICVGIKRKKISYVIFEEKAKCIKGVEDVEHWIIPKYKFKRGVKN